MNYTNCWLTYPLLVDETGKTITVSSDFSGPVADSALEELNTAFSGMFRRQATRVSGNADVALKKNEAIHPEGYAVSAGNGKATVESSGEKGMLYGVFALLRQLQLSGGSFDAFA